MSETTQLILTASQVEIIKAVLYFDVFMYPLTMDELFENSAITLSKSEFTEELGVLVANNFLKQEGSYVFSSEGNENYIRKREIGNEGAKAVMPTALKYSRVIASFPFVESVCLSGGLSKNYYDEKSDIDYFIVTKPNRLWICRTLLTIRYQLLPKDKQKYWCVNYFVSSGDLKIPDVNAFTGTELAYLIPTVNYTGYKKILEANSWYKKRFPNKAQAQNKDCIDVPNSLFKSFTELLFSGAFGKLVDDLLFSATLRHWRKRYHELLSPEDFDLQFRSKKNVCKRHTKGFQNKVLKLWDEKQKAFEAKFNMLLK